MENGRKETRMTKALKLWTGVTFAAFLAATATFAALLWVEKNELSGYESAQAYVAIREVPEGQLITEQNLEEYFGLKSFDVSVIPAAAIREAAGMDGFVARTTIDEGSLLTAGMLRPLDVITAGMKEPVVAGFRAEDLCQVVGGVLRAGDRIHVFASEEEGTFLIWEDVYVQQVFDAGGNVIDSGDESTAAQRINVFLDKEDVEDFYSRLDQGSLRVVKIWRREKKE